MNFDDFTLDDHIDAAYKLGAKHERAKIVAWIERRYASTISENIVQGIEAGEWEKP